LSSQSPRVWLDGVNHYFSAKSLPAARAGFHRDNAATFLELVRQSPVWCRRFGKAMMQCKVGLRF
jgi:hypothetical protein